MVYHPFVPDLVGDVGEAGANCPCQVRRRQGSLKAFHPASAPAQAEAWVRQGTDELQAVILLPQAQNDLSGDKVCPLCHARDERGKSSSNSFPDFCLQHFCQLFFCDFQLFGPMAGEAAAVFSQLRFIHE